MEDKINRMLTSLGNTILVLVEILGGKGTMEDFEAHKEALVNAFRLIQDDIFDMDKCSHCGGTGFVLERNGEKIVSIPCPDCSGECE